MPRLYQTISQAAKAGAAEECTKRAVFVPRASPCKFFISHAAKAGVVETGHGRPRARRGGSAGAGGRRWRRRVRRRRYQPTGEFHRLQLAGAAGGDACAGLEQVGQQAARHPRHDVGQQPPAPRRHPRPQRRRRRVQHLPRPRRQGLTYGPEQLCRSSAPGPPGLRHRPGLAPHLLWPSLGTPQPQGPTPCRAKLAAPHLASTCTACRVRI